MRVFVLLLALAALLVPEPAEAQIRLPSIRNRLIELALDQISTPGAFEVTAGAIEDADEGATSLIDVRVSDGTGVWLTIERLNFAWQPRRILSGELAISRLELIGLTVSRPPSAGAEPPQLKPQQPWRKGIFDWPRAPISVSIEGLRLERVTVAEGVLPQPIRFDARGRARDRGTVQEVELALDRTDGIEGRIALAFRRDFTADIVRLEIEAHEAPGGMVAAAAGLPPDAPARLTLKADGPPEDWRLTFDAGVERVFDADGTATLAYAERLSADADFSIVAGPDMGEIARAILGERTTLRARVAGRPDGMIEVLEGALASPALQLAATGALATGAGESDLAVQLMALPPLAALVDGLDFERFTFDGSVRGPQGGLAAEGALALTGLATAPADAALLTLDGRVAQTAGGLSFGLAGRGEGLRVDRIGPETIGAARLAAAGTLEGDLLSLDAASLASRALTVEASGSYDLATAAGTFGTSLDAPDIAPLAAAYGAKAEGAVAASAEVALTAAGADATGKAELTGFAMDPVAARRLALGGRVTQSEAGLGFDLAGEGAGLVLDEVPAELTREVALVLKGSLAGDMLGLDTLTLESPLVSAGASGTVGLEAGIDALALDLGYTLRTADFGPVAAAYGIDAAGALDASGRVGGTAAAPSLVGKAGIAAAAFAGRDYGAVSLTHDVTLGAAPAGSLALATRGGWLGDGTAATGFRLEGSRLALEKLTAALLGVSVAGAAAIDIDTTLADAALDVSAPDLAPLGRLAGTPMAGAATGRLALSAAGGRQDGSAGLTFRNLGSGEARLAAAELTLAAGDLRGRPRIEARLAAGGVLAGGVALDRAIAQAKGPLGAVEFSAEARGRLGRQPLAAELAGRADATGNPLRMTLARAEVTAGPDTVRLRQPLALRIGGGTVEATGLDIALPDDGGLTGSAARRPGGLTGNLTLTRLPLALLDRADAMQILGGTLDAHAEFDTRPGRARAELRLGAREVAFEKTQLAAGGLDLDAGATWDGSRLAADAELRGDFGDPLRARLALPVRPGRDGIPVVQARGAVEGAVDWSGDIGDLWALVPVTGHVLDGRTEVDLKVGGTLEAPQVDGGIRVRDGQYQNVDAGTILTGLEIATTIDRDGPVRIALDATDGAKGKVRADAELRLRGTPSVKLTATADQAVLVRRDDLRAKLGGRVTVSGPLTDLVATGDIVVERAEIRLVGGAPPDLVELDGVRIKGAPEADGQDRDRHTVALDIRVRAPRKIFVRGRGLDSEWKMDVAVTGDATEPVVTGEIERIRGVLDLIGRPFELKRGRVTFDGGREIDPVIDVSLEAEANGVRGGMVVEGRASDPDIRFVSVPAMPEEEVLPRLVFGRSRQSLSGPEAIQLAAGVATLMSGKAGPLDALRETVGLDVLRLEGTTAADATVTVGRNVADGVFVGAKQGLGERGTTVTVEVEVFGDVTADTEIAPDGSSSVGLTYRRDF